MTMVDRGYGYGSRFKVKTNGYSDSKMNYSISRSKSKGD